jgi:hypothetical protein
MLLGMDSYGLLLDQGRIVLPIPMMETIGFLLPLEVQFYHLWVAVGQGSGNTIATSSDGISWTGQGAVISIAVEDVAWNGSIWVAIGEGGAASIATSTDGITWIGRSTIFVVGYGVAWNGFLWVAVGNGPNHHFATSTDGIAWTGHGKTIMTNGGPIVWVGRDVAWNGALWIAVGQGSGTTIAYSYDGINWTGIATSVFSSSGRGIAWNGAMWVATGDGTNSTAYSYNGFNWTGVTSFSLGGNGVSFNSRRPYTLTFPTNSTSSIIGTVSSSISFPISVLSTSRLDVVSDTYYNGGYTNFSITINASRS